jgi:hypothetical protein
VTFLCRYSRSTARATSGSARRKNLPGFPSTAASIRVPPSASLTTFVTVSGTGPELTLIARTYEVVNDGPVTIILET